jgi:hypothetical protein
MLPLAIVGGVIGAVVSAIQGASWLSDQIGPSNATSAGGKGTPKAQADARNSPFEAALAAQVAGQTVPAGAGPAVVAANMPAVSAVMPPLTHGTDYDALARMKAGVVAYSHVGEHRANQAGAGKSPGVVGDAAVSRS